MKQRASRRSSEGFAWGSPMRPINSTAARVVDSKKKSLSKIKKGTGVKERARKALEAAWGCANPRCYKVRHIALWKRDPRAA